MKITPATILGNTKASAQLIAPLLARQVNSAVVLAPSITFLVTKLKLSEDRARKLLGAG